MDKRRYISDKFIFFCLINVLSSTAECCKIYKKSMITKAISGRFFSGYPFIGTYRYQPSGRGATDGLLKATARMSLQKDSIRNSFER